MSSSVWVAVGLLLLVVAVGLMTTLVVQANVKSTLRTMQGTSRRHAVIRTVRREPMVQVIDRFLSPEECKHLIHLASPLLKRSTVLGKPQITSSARSSSTAHLPRSRDTIVRAIEERAAQFVHMPVENVEALQVVKYMPGELYEPHYDYFEGPYTDQLARGGQRRYTFFVYLTTVPESKVAPTHAGSTWFPKLDLHVEAVEGRAAFWHNCNMNVKTNKCVVDSKMLHGGTAPTKSTKYGLNIWVRERTFT